jgi:hypothetical protein
MLLASMARATATLPGWGILLVLCACTAVAACDLIGRRGLTFPKRQTYSGAVPFAGLRTGQFIWGADIGLGFTTYRTSRLYWSALVMLVAGASPVLCFAGTFVYTASFFTSVSTHRYFLVAEEWMIRRRRRFGIVGVVVTITLMAVIASG